MSGSSSSPDAAFVLVGDGDSHALHLRCCDVYLKLGEEHEAVGDAIARHLSRVHGYIGTVDDDITLESLRRRLPTKPQA